VTPELLLIPAIYIGGIYLGLMIALDRRCNFRDGFWLCVGWPVLLLFVIIYGLYKFLPYLFYLRD